MLSKCSAFENKDDIEIEEVPACSENRVSEKALLQFICLQCFDIHTIKILRTISLVLGENEGRLQSCSLDLSHQEKLKHKCQLFISYLRLRTQGYKTRSITISTRLFFSFFKWGVRTKDGPGVHGPPILDRVHGPAVMDGFMPPSKRN